MRKNIPITNKFKQTFNIFKKGKSQFFALPHAFIEHYSRLIRYRTLKKIIFFSLMQYKRNNFFQRHFASKKKKKIDT